MSEIVDSGGQNTNNNPNSTNPTTTFSQTCNLLSQYLKENGSLGDLTLPSGMAKKSSNQDEEQSHRLTLFYGGQMMVVDDFPADKAMEIMRMLASAAAARSGNSNPQNSSTPPAVAAVVCDLPIARKASLARFLEKRKERIRARAAYAYEGSPSKQANEKKQQAI